MATNTNSPSHPSTTNKKELIFLI